MGRTFRITPFVDPHPKSVTETYGWFRQRVKKLENDPAYDYQMGSGQDS
jgi:hypothetical protein